MYASCLFVLVGYILHFLLDSQSLWNWNQDFHATIRPYQCKYIKKIPTLFLYTYTLRFGISLLDAFILLLPFVAFQLPRFKLFRKCLFFSLLLFFLDLSSYSKRSSRVIYHLLWMAVLSCCSCCLFLVQKFTINDEPTTPRRRGTYKLIALGCIAHLKLSRYVDVGKETTPLGLIPHLPPHPSSAGEGATIATVDEGHSCRIW